ncbi:hypothetical protein [Cupriavidus sp. USMAHM13]|nr:hypothetical protein [Cupriavidus sp. USMAHM13]
MKLYVDCEFSNSIACELISIALADEDVGGVIPHPLRTICVLSMSL